MARADALAEYNRKRDFEKTAEPSGTKGASDTGNSFIVQKHDATRLHWDLRLEADGVLKSWAVTKGPSPDPDIKRLAVRTEDHPISYAEFEGVIPKGEYGGGTVMLWDRGTWEPVEGKSDTGNAFIVQKHDATRLHWDLRLEADGVLKSWAVTKGPSPDPDIKRLAVRTEDHPISYAEFEGVIPKDEYGGGTVMLWDRGTWEPVEGKSWKDIDKGHLHFTLEGERMKGEWLLIRLKPRPGEKRENWLLRKLQDDHAEEGDPLVQRELTSVLTGRSMAQSASGEEYSL